MVWKLCDKEERPEFKRFIKLLVCSVCNWPDALEQEILRGSARRLPQS